MRQPRPNHEEFRGRKLFPDQKRSSPAAEKRRPVPNDQHLWAGLPLEGAPRAMGQETSPPRVAPSLWLVTGSAPTLAAHGLGAGLPSRQARASLSLGPLPTTVPPPQLTAPLEGFRGGTTTQARGLPGNQVLPSTANCPRALTRRHGDAESRRRACPAARSTCLGHRDGSTGVPWLLCPPGAPSPGSFSPAVPLRGGGMPRTRLLGASRKACWDLPKGGDRVRSGRF